MERLDRMYDELLQMEQSIDLNDEDIACNSCIAKPGVSIADLADMLENGGEGRFEDPDDFLYTALKDNNIAASSTSTFVEWCQSADRMISGASANPTPPDTDKETKVAAVAKVLFHFQLSVLVLLLMSNVKIKKYLIIIIIIIIIIRNLHQQQQYRHRHRQHCRCH
jgi:hypothetical protein